VVPVPIAPGMPPVPIVLSPTIPGPSDQQIIEGAKSVLDTVAHYTGIEALADWLRPKNHPDHGAANNCTTNNCTTNDGDSAFTTSAARTTTADNDGKGQHEGRTEGQSRTGRIGQVRGGCC
jgi:hypothetical protein